MADSLDDFFAKKDKKRKNKSQSAALSNEALVRELEEGSKQSEYDRRRELKTSAAMELLGLNANDNEWKDFEEVEKRDYTGLKVKEMSIQDQDDEQRRLVEQSEQVPEAIPWKSKQDTVAAIISAKNESNQLAGELAEQDGSAPNDATTPATAATTATTATTTTTTTITTTPATAATTTTTETTSSKTDNTDSDASKVAPSSGKAEDEKPADAATAATAVAKEEPKEEAKEAAGGSGADASKKEGDSKPAAVVKKVYVPPHERLEKEYKVLEPTRLSKIRSSSSRFGGARINIENEQDFPSLG